MEWTESSDRDIRRTLGLGEAEFEEFRAKVLNSKDQCVIDVRLGGLNAKCERADAQLITSAENASVELTPFRVFIAGIEENRKDERSRTIHSIRGN